MTTVNANDTADAGTSRPARRRPRLKLIACHRCHSRKVKCSGDQPCEGCRRASKESECIYPAKNRTVRIKEVDLKTLIAENERLRSRETGIFEEQAARSPTPHVLNDARDEVPEPVLNNPDTPQDRPGLPREPWFVNMTADYTPILIAEAADPAFATRLRQVMAPQEQQPHLPRVHYPTDYQLAVLSETHLQWPDRARAKLLADVAVKCLGRCYHIVRPSELLGEVEVFRDRIDGIGSLHQSRLLAVFAIGELYITRTSVCDAAFPGLVYFAHAMKLARATPERPSLAMVEVQLLLSWYALLVNRRHSAYSLAGSAIRLAVIMGLHLPVPLSLLRDPCQREQRKRIWWTAYVFDRMWATKLGYPVGISDAEIEIDLPTDLPGEVGQSDFRDSAYLAARIELARLCGRLINSIYGRKASAGTASLYGRVQQAFTELRLWMQKLPDSLRSDTSPTDTRAVSLHLLFNQLAMQITRPILLHTLKTKRLQTNVDDTVPKSALSLCESCVQYARNSTQLLVESWTNGTFMIFDYSYTQYMFSAATVLLISSLSKISGHESDLGRFKSLSHFLAQLKQNGNFVAAEFCSHIDAIESLLRLEDSTDPSRPDDTEDAVNLPGMYGDTDCSLPIDGTDPFGGQILVDTAADLRFIDESIYASDFDLYWQTGLSEVLT